VTELQKLLDGIYAEEGPIGLDRYMALCLGHPTHGYYMKRDPFGERGDFVTAPEITPLFGEVLGIWLAAMYGAMGRPKNFNLIELGPGRGTLMADMLKAAKTVPGFAEAAHVHLVETSPVLKRLQQWKLGNSVTWHDSLATVPQGPFLLVANEFFDALPVRQYEFRRGVWNERLIGAEGISLRLGSPGAGRMGKEGDVFETAPARSAVAQEIGRRLAFATGAALIIDYGHLQSGMGDTLQALHRHKMVPITHLPGESDLTSHVDFEALGHAIAKAGGRVAPAVTQRDFLLRMGLEIRASVLAAKADAGQLAMLNRVVGRLVDEDQMGKLFKVLAATSPNLATPYPFGGP
jgi:NADH dehydrogenase [ubiquinone] 1 alpha subcomplex assembly factor 7